MNPPRFMTPSSYVRPPEYYAIESKVFHGWHTRCACCYAWVNMTQTGAIATAEKYEGDAVETAHYAICDKCLAAGYAFDPEKQRKVWEYLFGCESNLLIVHK